MQCMKQVFFIDRRKPVSLTLLIVGLFFLITWLYALVTGRYVDLGGRGNKWHGSIIFKDKNPAEFSSWLWWSATISFSSVFFAFIKIVPIENGLLSFCDWMRQFRDAMIAEQPPWWAYVIWVMLILVVICSVYFALK